MEIILLHDVEKLGHRGQIVKVADGFGRNYLLPRKLAVAATSENKKWVEQQRVKFLKMEAHEQAEAQELATLMQGVSIRFTRKAGEHGTLFGSVTAIDVAEQLASEGYTIDRRKVQLDPPLKLVGEYDVKVKLHRDVTATVKVTINAETDEAAAGWQSVTPKPSTPSTASDAGASASTSPDEQETPE